MAVFHHFLKPLFVKNQFLQQSRFIAGRHRIEGYPYELERQPAAQKQRVITDRVST